MSSRYRGRRSPRRIRGVENRQHGDGSWTFRVRWKDPASGQRLSEEFDDQRDAVDFKDLLRRARGAGRLADVGKARMPLSVFVADRWWPNYALPNLERNSLENYASIWNCHLLPRIGHLQMRQITVEAVAELRSALEQSGAGAPTIVKALAILQGICRQARLWGYIEGANPVQGVPKPQIVRGAIRPPGPLVIERIAARMPTQRERVLVYLIAYQRLRPQEALALQPHHVGEQTILVEQKNVDGELLPYQKVRGKPPRSVGLLSAVGEEIATLLAEHSNGSGLLIACDDGAPWTEADYSRWRRSCWQPAVVALGIGTTAKSEDGRRSYKGPKPYWLRHAGVSLLLRERRLSLAELAEENGHSIQTLLKDYTHVIAELRGLPMVSVEQQIADARERLKAEAA